MSKDIIILIISGTILLIINQSSSTILKLISFFKIKDEKRLFMRDLAKLQIKHAKRGNAEYAKAISWTIESFNIPDELEPETNYGKKIKEELKQVENEEF